MKISVAIITYNEAANIARCINSVLSIADEIVVVDSHSTDNTKKICQSFENIRFVSHSFEGHIQQKNVAMHLAKHDWVLSLDADECLSDALLSSLKKIKGSEEYSAVKAYKFNRLSNYCGQWIKYGGWYPDTKIRLWHKDYGQWGGENPHDKVVLIKNEKAKFLQGDILHYTFSNLEQHNKQIEKFTSIAAQAKFDKGERSTILKAYIKGFAKWIRNFIVKQGWRDGKVGLHLANASAKATFLRYKKLNALWKN